MISDVGSVVWAEGTSGFSGYRRWRALSAEQCDASVRPRGLNLSPIVSLPCDFRQATRALWSQTITHRTSVENLLQSAVVKRTLPGT